MKENENNNQNSYINTYLKTAFEKLNKKQSEIIKDLGVSQAYVSALMNGKKRVGKEMAKKISKLYGFDEGSILTGEGEMLKSEGEPEIIKEEKGKIPYYDVDFAGGWSTEELFTNAMPAYYISAPEFAKSEFACNLRGNSISNRIKSGAIIGLKEISDWEIYFPTNELYAVITKNDLRTVKIVKWGKDKKYLELIPDPLPEFNNPPYETETIPVDFVSKMFQVVAWGYYERLVV